VQGCFSAARLKGADAFKIPVLVYGERIQNYGRCACLSTFYCRRMALVYRTSQFKKGSSFAKAIKAKITGISVIPEQEYYLYQMQVQVKRRRLSNIKCRPTGISQLSKRRPKDAGVPAIRFVNQRSSL